MKNIIAFIGLSLAASIAFANDFTLSWSISSPTGVTEYAIGSKVNGITQPVEYTGSTALSDTIARTVVAGQPVVFYVSACSAVACGPWGPSASLVAGSTTPPAGIIQTTTATSVRIGPVPLP